MTGIERAIERQKNLEAEGKDDTVHEFDTEAGGRYCWDDRYIDIIPYKDREGVALFFYRNEKNTAAISLTLRGAIVLANNLVQILDEQFQPQISALMEKLEDKPEVVE